MPAMKQVAFDHLGEVASMTMLAGEREPLNSDFYLKWVRPLGFRDVIGVLVLKSGKRVAWFSVARSDIQSRFDESDLRQMELLSPHICRALLISDALDMQSIVATRLAETVDHLSTGILLTEEHGRIAYMNGSAEAILKDGNTLKSRDGRLVAVRSEARDSLSRALEESMAGKAPSARQEPLRRTPIFDPPLSLYPPGDRDQRARDRLRFVPVHAGRADRRDPHVEHPVARRDPGQLAAVGRDVRTDALGVAEKHFTGDEINHEHMPITRPAMVCGAKRVLSRWRTYPENQCAGAGLVLW
jgi:hypothetical protein